MNNYKDMMYVLSQVETLENQIKASTQIVKELKAFINTRYNQYSTIKDYFDPWYESSIHLANSLERLVSKYCVENKIEIKISKDGVNSYPVQILLMLDKD
jgi:hypothetical protein